MGVAMGGIHIDKTRGLKIGAEAEKKICS